MNPLTDLFRLFFPPLCSACREPLVEGGQFICTRCRLDMPITEFWDYADNPVYRKFHGNLPVVNACSFLFFIYGSGYQSMIHSLKYGGGWRIGVELGEWFGTELANSELYRDVDIVVPVPLHLIKRLKRGYNQAEYIAKGLSKAMGIELEVGNLVRTAHKKSQTSLSKDKRWDNVHGIFSLRHPERLEGRHILLVDDVLTTGSTVISCGQAILSRVPNARISIATIAVPRGELKE